MTNEELGSRIMRAKPELIIRRFIHSWELGSCLSDVIGAHSA